MSEDKKLVFENISYRVPNGKVKAHGEQYIELISRISGEISPGKITGIMGPSGGCKTTFMRLLAGETQPGAFTDGEIRYGESERDLTWRHRIAYLEQDDIEYKYETIDELIDFRLKCAGIERTTALEDQKRKIYQDFGLTEMKNRQIGALSGGERKRVLIASEVLLNRDILMLDEPTTGLDSHLALELMLMIKKYVQEENRIALISLHQPGPALFELIDDLIFFFNGDIIYHGPAAQCESFLADRGFINPPDRELSTAEFLFELFADVSAFTEIQVHQDNLRKLTTESKEKKKEANRGRTFKATDDRFIDASIDLPTVWALYKRRFLYDWRGLYILKGLGLTILLLIGNYLVSRTDYAECKTLLTFPRRLHITHRYPPSDLVNTKEDFKLYNFEVENKFVYYLEPILCALVLLMDYSAKNCSPAPRELKKSMYSPLSAALAFFLSRLTYTIMILCLAASTLIWVPEHETFSWQVYVLPVVFLFSNLISTAFLMPLPHHWISVSWATRVLQFFVFFL